MSARTQALDALQTIIAGDVRLEDVRLVRAPRDVGEIATPILQVRTSTWEPTAVAPLRNLTWNGIATLVSPHLDIDRAEDQLEELFDALSDHLRTSNMLWTGATLTAYEDGQHLALDINLFTIYQKE